MARSGLISALSPAVTARRADTDSRDGRRKRRRKRRRNRSRSRSRSRTN